MIGFLEVTSMTAAYATLLIITARCKSAGCTPGTNTLNLRDITLILFSIIVMVMITSTMHCGISPHTIHSQWQVEANHQLQT